MTVTLYDLTNTYFEGVAAAQPLAQHGHSKEKRSDCPLLTLGLVVDGSGFVRRSEVMAGNIVEGEVLQGALKRLEVPTGALIVKDCGAATEKNLKWLREQGYRYLVVSRERKRQFDGDGGGELADGEPATGTGPAGGVGRMLPRCACIATRRRVRARSRRC